MEVREVYSPLRLAASGMICDQRGLIGGFFCTTSGTLSITSGILAGGSDIISSFSVVAGTYYPLGIRCKDGAYANLTTAVGTFMVA